VENTQYEVGSARSRICREGEIALYTRFLLQAETPQDRANHGETVVKLGNGHHHIHMVGTRTHPVDVNA